MTIAERIASTQNRLDTARSRRAGAILDGRKYDLGEVAAVEAELEALSDAAAEEVRRERAASAHTRMTRRGEQIARLQELDRQRTGALETAEDGARQLADSLAKALALNAQMAAEFRELNDMVPMPMQPIAAAGRLSNRLGAVLAATFKSRRIGNLELRHSTEKSEACWAVEEARLIKPYLEPLLEKKS